MLEPQSVAATDHRAEQRRRILGAAIACFSRDGFHGTSMQQICAEAGMSPGALYRYFPSKEAIIGAIVEGEGAERARLFERLNAAPDLIDALSHCMRELLSESTMIHARLGPEIMAEAIRNVRLREALLPVQQESFQMLRAALARGVSSQQIDGTTELDDLVILLHVIGDGMNLNNLLHPEWRLAERLPALSACLRRMLAPPPTGEAAP